MRLRWPWIRNGRRAEQIRRRAEEMERETRKDTARIRRVADATQLTPEEFVDRVSRAFGRHA